MALMDERNAIDDTNIPGNGKTRTMEPELRPQTPPRPEQPEKESRVGPLMISGLAGLGAAVLALLGLAGILIRPMDALAAIIIGAAFVSQSTPVVAQFGALFSRERRPAFSGLASELTVNVIGGIGGIILGLLALFGVAPSHLLGITAILYGATLLLSVGVLANLFNRPAGSQGAEDTLRHLTHEVLMATGSLHILVGIAGVVMGIIALTGVYPYTLTLVTMLAIGFVLFVSGSTAGLKKQSPER